MLCSWEKDPRQCLEEGKLLNQRAQPSPFFSPRQDFTGAPAAAQTGWEQTTRSLARSLPEVGANLFFTQGEGRGVSRGQAREVV